MSKDKIKKLYTILLSKKLTSKQLDNELSEALKRVKTKPLDPKAFRENLKHYKSPSLGRPRYYLGPYFPNVFLTQREADCAVLAIEGFTNRVIGAQLAISDQTVEFYLTNVKQKLGVRKRSNMMRLLRMSRLLKVYQSKS